MIYIAKLISLFLGALVITKSFHDYKKGVENFTMFIFWNVAWITVIIVAIFPEIITSLIVKTGGQRTGIGTIFGMSLVFLFYVTYRVYLKAQKIEQDLQKLTRSIGLKKIHYSNSKTHLDKK